MLIYVRVFFKDGTEDIKQVFDIADICLDGVRELRVIGREAA